MVRWNSHVQLGIVQEAHLVERPPAQIEGGQASGGPDRIRQARTGPRSGQTGSSKTGSSKASSGVVRDATPPDQQASRRTRANAEMREAVAGREHEFLGLGLIGAAVLLGLAMYFDLAGPLGRGVETLFGWLAGLGRYAVPVVLAAIGVSLIRRGRTSSPVRLGVGWAMVAAGSLGLLHVLRGPDELTADVDLLEPAGGWLGALVAEPLKALVGSVGATVVLLVVLVGGALLITQTSMRTMASHTGGFLATIAMPVGRWAKSGLSNISTLSSDRAEGTTAASPDGRAAATLYDFAQDDDLDVPGEPPKRSRGPKPKVSVGSQPGVASPDGARVGEWVLPPMTFLDRPGEQTIDRKEVESRGRMLQESLASHGVETMLVGMTVGPTVTRYELELGLGVKVARVTSLQKDIAYAMAATDVRILAPIPGRSAIGVEVPNRQRQLVALGDLLASPEAAKATNPLEVAVGKDIAGKAVFLDLAATPHLLIAGATGAGKSSGINCIITSLLMRTTPDDVRLILIDPKQVEMGQYQRLPHLLTQPVTNPKKAANALGWAVKEMERRYDLLSEMGYRDIAGYNKAFAKGEIVAPPGSVGRVRAPHLHRGRGRRAERLDDGRGPRRRGVDHPDRPEGAGGRHPPHRRHAAAVGERDHRCDQGEHPGAYGLRRVEPHRLAGDPRPAGRREAGRQGRHAAPARQLVGVEPHPGLVRERGGGAQGGGALAGPVARTGLLERCRGGRRARRAAGRPRSAARARTAEPPHEGRCARGNVEHRRFARCHVRRQRVLGG